jgi:hypothetical protein
VLEPLAGGFQAELVEGAELREVRASKVALGTSRSSVGRGAYRLPSWNALGAQPATAAHNLDSTTLNCEKPRSLPTLQEPTMDNEIQLISDGDGLAVIGNPTAVERFLVSEGLPSKDLGLQRLGPALSTGAAAAQAGSEIAANSGRWVKLTKESAQIVHKHGLRESSKTGLSTGVLKGSHGQIK